MKFEHHKQNVAPYSGVAFLSITAVFFAPIAHRLLHILQVEPKDKETEK